jgi:hypothetical protein
MSAIRGCLKSIFCHAERSDSVGKHLKNIRQVVILHFTSFRTLRERCANRMTNYTYVGLFKHPLRQGLIVPGGSGIYNSMLTYAKQY